MLQLVWPAEWAYNPPFIPGLTTLTLFQDHFYAWRVILKAAFYHHILDQFTFFSTNVVWFLHVWVLFWTITVLCVKLFEGDLIPAWTLNTPILMVVFFTGSCSSGISESLPEGNRHWALCAHSSFDHIDAFSASCRSCCFLNKEKGKWYTICVVQFWMWAD